MNITRLLIIFWVIFIIVVGVIYLKYPPPKTYTVTCGIFSENFTNKLDAQDYVGNCSIGIYMNIK